MRGAFPDPAPRLVKAAASGNDFLVADARALPGWDPGAAAARALCRRHRGLGADGLVVLGPSRRADAAFFLRNSDGSAAAFSGNGARCAALLLHELGVRRPEGRVDLELPHRTCPARVMPQAGSDGAALVEVSVGAPSGIRLDWDLPGRAPAAQADHAVVGVPYLAVRLADRDALARLDIAAAAPPLRHWSALPEGANVAFYCVEGAGPVPLRTWERGVEGETQSSGTGCSMVALAVALREAPVARRTLELLPSSGAPLRVTVVREGDAVTDILLEGEARLLAEMQPLSGSLLPDG